MEPGKCAVMCRQTGRDPGVRGTDVSPGRQTGIFYLHLCACGNEGSISRFLAKHEEFEIVPIDKAKLGIPEGCDGIPACVENPAPGITGTLRLWPHKLRGEGHYAAVLQKRESFRKDISQ